MFKLIFFFGLCCMASCSTSSDDDEDCYSGPECQYPIYSFRTEQMDFFGAHFRCKELQMELASITSVEEQANLQKYLLECANQMTDGPSMGAWLSGTRLGGNDFRWLTNGQPLIYRAFFPGQPDNSGSDEDCVQIYRKQNKFLWNDIECTRKHGYICQSRRCFC